MGGGINQNKCYMKTIGEQMINSLRLQVVMNGVWDIDDAIKNNPKMSESLSEKVQMDGTITKDSLADLINDFYDFNEFGGLTTDYVSNLMRVMMPLYVQMQFINEVQDEMLDKACERINERLTK